MRNKPMTMLSTQTKEDLTGSITVRLVGLVERILANNANARPISLSMRLADLGVTSIQMVTLMLTVEAEFDLTIPQSEITPENFQSIASIAALIQKLRPESEST
jgi:acyl carrier protein